MLGTDLAILVVDIKFVNTVFSIPTSALYAQDKAQPYHLHYQQKKLPDPLQPHLHLKASILF